MGLCRDPFPAFKVIHEIEWERVRYLQDRVSICIELKWNRRCGRGTTHLCAELLTIAQLGKQRQPALLERGGFVTRAHVAARCVEPAAVARATGRAARWLLPTEWPAMNAVG